MLEPRVDAQYIAAVMERKQSVDENARVTFEKISIDIQQKDAEFERRENEISRMGGSRKKRLTAFLALVSDVRAVAAPHVPCKKGCSACCYQQVEISVLEAEHIEAKTGNKAKRVMPGTSSPGIYAFGSDTPCTFLGADGVCFIYEARPFACRDFVTIDVDSLLCRPENIRLTAERHPAATGVPFLESDSLNALYWEIVGADTCADIRTFFPPPG